MPCVLIFLTSSILKGHLKRSKTMWQYLAADTGSSSSMQCPTFGNDTNLNLPCMLAISNSLSSRSLAAMKQIFENLEARNVELRPFNQSYQNFSLRRRSFFHTTSPLPFGFSVS